MKNNFLENLYKFFFSSFRLFNAVSPKQDVQKGVEESQQFTDAPHAKRAGIWKFVELKVWKYIFNIFENFFLRNCATQRMISCKATAASSWKWTSPLKAPPCTTSFERVWKYWEFEEMKAKRAIIFDFWYGAFLQKPFI